MPPSLTYHATAAHAIIRAATMDGREVPWDTPWDGLRSRR